MILPIRVRKRRNAAIVRIKAAIKKTKKERRAAFVNRDDTSLVQWIRGQTMERNKNNVTRTQAYLDFYFLHPEIHWAFLGHMVSRNGGWNMTDLKGELLSGLLSREEKQSFFSFLERGNWLIFQDVYPQFLLYQESLRQNRPLFHLVSQFHVSLFMEAVWNEFWRQRNAYTLTIALIINEQNYLEKRVVQNPRYQEKVMKTFEFKLQDYFSFNQILFPYRESGRVRLAGRTLHRFGSLHDRIMLGKRLYKILFHDHERLRQVEKWAGARPHTGSRKDYWPDIFNDIHEGLPGETYQLKLKSCGLRPGARRIYSPALELVWKDVRHRKAEEGDWFKDWRILDYFNELNETIDGEVENDYCKTLERLELAALAKKALSI